MRHVLSTDGVEVAVHDLGGDGPPLVLAHATGFCGGVLAPMARSLGRSFHAWALDVRGHGAASTPAGLDFGWAGFADDVLAVVDDLGLEGAYAFGHSSGGAAMLDAEARRPGTFRALYVYEPILWPSPPPASIRDVLVASALRRRDRFPSRDAARANYLAKGPFSAFAPEALDAYLACGFEPLEDGSVRLRCRGEWEAAIYSQGVVHDGFTRLGRVACPVTVASGDRGESLDADTVAAQAAALPLGRLETFAGLGHLGPMEDPARVARSVAEALAD